MKDTNNSTQAENSHLKINNASNYTQLYSVGKDVRGQAFEAKLIDGFPYYRLLISNSESGEYQKFVETIDGTTNIKFKAIAAMPGLCYNGTTSYVVVLTEDGQVGFLYQEISNNTWRWYGIMRYEEGYKGQYGYYNWISVNIGNNGNAQVVLINETGTPVLLWQDNSSGSWTWDWLPVNNSINPPNFDLHLTTVQLGKGNSGNLQAVFTGQDGLPYLIWQDNSNGIWSLFGKLPGDQGSNYSLVQLANGNNNNLQCVFQDSNNQLYLIWLDNNSGIWNWYGRLPLASEVNKSPIISYMLRKSGDTLNLLITYESNGPEGFDVYRILQDSKGIWTWEGLYKTTNDPYP